MPKGTIFGVRQRVGAGAVAPLVLAGAMAGCSNGVDLPGGSPKPNFGNMIVDDLRTKECSDERYAGKADRQNGEKAVDVDVRACVGVEGVENENGELQLRAIATVYATSAYEIEDPILGTILEPDDPMSRITALTLSKPDGTVQKIPNDRPEFFQSTEPLGAACNTKFVAAAVVDLVNSSDDIELGVSYKTNKCNGMDLQF
jgi:hypothetical protein